jgi:hemerythrin superfamily protein
MNPKTNEHAHDEPEYKDAIDLLTADHHEVEKLFKQYKRLTHKDADSEQRQELAHKICQALSVHAQIEEELFYPALREASDETDLLDEAAVEHASVKDLVEQLTSSKPDQALYDAKVTVLAEYVNHHVKEEEGPIFKKARKAKLDLDDLGMRMAERKQELMEAPMTAKKSSRSSHKGATSHSSMN